MRIRKITAAGMTSDAYAAGDVIGGVMTLEGVLTHGHPYPVLRQIMIHDASTACPAIDILILDSNVSTDTTITDNAIVDIADGDLTKIIGLASVTTTMGLNDNSIAVLSGLYIPLESPTGAKDLYALAVAQGASIADWHAVPPEFVFSFSNGE